MIHNITADIEIDKIYEGKIVSTTNFGAFMEVLPGRDGMIHISELASYRVEEVEDVVRVGDRVTAKCIGVDDKKRVKMSRKAALEEKGEPQTEPTYEIGERKPREDRGGRDAVAVAEIAVVAVAVAVVVVIATRSLI